MRSGSDGIRVPIVISASLEDLNLLSTAQSLFLLDISIFGVALNLFPQASLRFFKPFDLVMIHRAGS